MLLGHDTYRYSASITRYSLATYNIEMPLPDDYCNTRVPCKSLRILIYICRQRLIDKHHMTMRDCGTIAILRIRFHPREHTF
jgi:hypothetical protein